MDNEQEDKIHSHGDSVSVRPDGSAFVSADDAAVQETVAEDTDANAQGDDASIATPDTKLANLTVAQYTQLDQFMLTNNALDVPTSQQIEQLGKLRELTPELYTAFIEAFQKNSEASFLERTEPMRIADAYSKRGQFIGAFIVILTLCVVVYAIVEQAYWMAGVLGTFDLVALAAVFGSKSKPTGSQKDSDEQ